MTLHVPEGWVDQLSYQGSSTEWASIAFSCMKNLFVQEAEFTLPLSIPWSSSVKRSPCWMRERRPRSHSNRCPPPLLPPSPLTPTQPPPVCTLVWDRCPRGGPVAVRISLDCPLEIDQSSILILLSLHQHLVSGDHMSQHACHVFMEL